MSPVVLAFLKSPEAAEGRQVVVRSVFLCLDGINEVTAFSTVLAVCQELFLV